MAEDAPGTRSGSAPAMSVDGVHSSSFIGGTLSEIPIERVRGVGQKRGEVLREAGVNSVADLLLRLPRRYLDRSVVASAAEAELDREVTLVCRVESVGQPPRTRHGRGRRLPSTVVVADDSGSMRCVWFEGGRFLRFQVGDLLALSGKVTEYRGQRQMAHPEVEFVADAEDPDLLHTGGIIPLYTSSQDMKDRGLRSRGFRRLVRSALDEFGSEARDDVSAEMEDRLDLMPLTASLRAGHFPGTAEEAEAARKRLAFGELLDLQLAIERARRRRLEGGGGISFPASQRLRPALRDLLPFSLTPAQERVMGEIDEDMQAPVPMRRLLHGDVGSGKTLVALGAALAAVEGGYQVAIMAPTEVLAEQHAHTLRSLLEPLGLRLVLLLGGQTPTRRLQLLAAVVSGEAQLIVGTQALLQGDVHFGRLGFIVVDEQHRFGVSQRSDLYAKNPSADVLIMTATPIPRSLALTLYGDLEVSVLDEIPPGRQPVRTAWRLPDRRDRIFAFVADELRKGRQAFIVYPLIEESEQSDMTSAIHGYEELRSGPLAGFEVALLHGRLPADEKADVMGRFAQGSLQALVATTVIEVGIDVPNATVIVVEHAERFGLAQLHQLRGRVGRGPCPSHCILIAYTEAAGEDGVWEERLRAMCETQDGFVLARRDLELRGPGELLGTRQAGFGGLVVASLVRDESLLVLAREEARAELDPDAPRPGGAAAPPSPSRSE